MCVHRGLTCDAQVDKLSHVHIPIPVLVQDLKGLQYLGTFYKNNFKFKKFNAILFKIKIKIIMER